METFKVKVLGNEYSVRADSDGDHVSRVASIVDERMKKIDSQYQQGSPTRTAVLACMNLVDDHFSENRKRAEWLKRRVGTLIEKLDTVI